MSIINDYLCEIRGLGVKTDSGLCVWCGKWIDGRCAGANRITKTCEEILLSRNVLDVLERWRSMKKCYVMKWKQYECLHIVVTG